MHIQIGCEIHYYLDNKGAVVVTSNNTDKERLIGEALLFCCYTLRVLAGLDPKSPVGSAIGEMLASEFAGAVILEKSPEKTELINFPGNRSNKYLGANLTLDEPILNYSIHNNGLDDLGADIKVFGPTSILLLFEQLVKSHIESADNVTHLQNLSRMANQCSAAFHSGRLNPETQYEYAGIILGMQTPGGLA